MKKTKFTEQQFAFALRQAETGTRVAEIYRKMGISETSEYPCFDRVIKEKVLYPGFKSAVLYMNFLQELYHSIKSNGYMSIKRIIFGWSGEIEVAIGREGKLIKINLGKHRFACAYYLIWKNPNKYLRSEFVV